MPFSAGLKVKLNIIKSSNGLLTIRTEDQTLLLLFNTLIGSVFGILGAMGSVMRTFEGRYLAFKNANEQQTDMEALKMNRKSLKELTSDKSILD